MNHTIIVRGEFRVTVGNQVLAELVEAGEGDLIYDLIQPLVERDCAISDFYVTEIGLEDANAIRD